MMNPAKIILFSFTCVAHLFNGQLVHPIRFYRPNLVHHPLLQIVEKHYTFKPVFFIG